MKSLGFYVLNGRTKGDIPGNYTFSNHREKNITDHAWVNLKFSEYISNFRIHFTIDNAEHAIFIINSDNYIFNNTEAPTYNNSQFNIKFKFKPYNSQKYVNVIGIQSEECFHSKSSTELCNNLICAIKNTICKRGMMIVSDCQSSNSTENFIENKIWFNWESKKSEL